MTPADILSQARSQFDDPSSAFITDAEGYAYIWQAFYELCAQSDIIQTTQSVTTVAGTESYSFNIPPNGTTRAQDWIKILLVTWDDETLFRKDLEKFQQIRGKSPGQGNPQYYRYFGTDMALNPIPNAAKTLKVYGTNRPNEITSSNANSDIYQIWEIEEAYQQDCIDYVLMRMYLKDDDRKADVHRDLWEGHLRRIALEQKQVDFMSNHTTVTTTDDDSIPWSSL